MRVLAAEIHDGKARHPSPPGGDENGHVTGSNVVGDSLRGPPPRETAFDQLSRHGCDLPRVSPGGESNSEGQGHYRYH